MLTLKTSEIEFKNYYEDFIKDIFEYLEIKENNEFKEILLYLLFSIQEGNLCIDLNANYPERFLNYLQKNIGTNTSSINHREVILKLKQNKQFDKIFEIHNQKFLFFKRHFEALKVLKNKLNPIISYDISQTLNFEKTQLIKEYTKKIKDKLNEEQIQGVLLSILVPFLVISGGPGTGKTTIASHIIGIHLEIGLSPEQMAIAAPTGRAASRLKESIDKNLKDILKNKHFELIKPFTLHRLLKFQPIKGEFYYNQTNLLRYKLIIIDEASMIDIYLIQNLFLALPNLSKDTKVIFLGDKNQLPSVLEGNVLEDLIPKNLNFPNISKINDYIKKIYPITKDIKNPYYIDLKQSYRNLKEIKILADLIIEDENSSDKAIQFLEQYKQETNDFLKMESPIVWIDTNHKKKIYKIIEKYIEERLYNQNICKQLLSLENKSREEWEMNKINEIYENILRYKILSPTRFGDLGVNKINERVKEYIFLQKKLKSGYPTIILENDYYNQLFNGDIGILLRDKNQNETMYFKNENNFRYYSLLSLKRYEFAFALTIHKSQGSEYNEVIILLPDLYEEDNIKILNLLNKKILYTAITRAKEKLYIIASKATLKSIIENSLKRISIVDLWE
ncbi:MAG: exodeoxyribonuclease V subunit alpha [Leptonema sp. (in: bacteria)]